MSSNNYKQLRKFTVDNKLFYWKVETSLLITLYDDKKKPLAKELGLKGVDPANLKTLEEYIRNNFIK